MHFMKYENNTANTAKWLAMSLEAKSNPSDITIELFFTCKRVSGSAKHRVNLREDRIHLCGYICADTSDFVPCSQTYHVDRSRRKIYELSKTWNHQLCQTGCQNVWNRLIWEVPKIHESSANGVNQLADCCRCCLHLLMQDLMEDYSNRPVWRSGLFPLTEMGISQRNRAVKICDRNLQCQETNWWRTQNKNEEDADSTVEKFVVWECMKAI
jgi:hypothetical protein